MSKPQYNSEQLIANIKRRSLVPTSQKTYEDSDFVTLATDILQDEVIPLIMSNREEYFIFYVDHQVDSTGIIPMPAESIGAKLRSVCYVQSTTPLVMLNLPRIDLEVVSGSGTGNGWLTTFAGFYIQNNSIILFPNNSVAAGTTIRLYYYKRAFNLADPDNYGQIVSIDTGSNTVVLSNVPTTWAVDTELNSVSQTPTFDITNELMTITAVSSPSIVLDTVEGLEVGDYITELGYSAIPQIPVEAMGYLAQLTGAKVLEGLGDREGMKAALAKAEAIKTGLMITTSNRVDGSPKKVINPSGGLRLGSSLRVYGSRSNRGW